MSGSRSVGRRRFAREFALQVLYQIEINPSPIDESIDRLAMILSPEESERKFATVIIQGVVENLERIDSLLQQYSHHWKVSRMSSIDRNILRMGVFELLYMPDIPVKVTINEAIEIGKKFGTEESGSFINAILDRIARTEDIDKPSGKLT